MESLTDKEILVLYENFLTDHKQYSQRTVVSYLNDIEGLIAFLENENLGDLLHLTNRIAKFYVAYLHNEYNPKTIRRKISSVKTLYNFLIEEEYLDDNPFLTVALPKVTRSLPKFVYEEEMINFLNRIDTLKATGKRNKAIFEVLYGCGLRVSELIEIKIEDIDFLNDTIKVIGKGSKERIVPIHELGLKEIETYLYQGRPELMTRSKESNNYVFVNFNGKKLTARGVRYKIGRAHV